jgi:hypothetical protein
MDHAPSEAEREEPLPIFHDYIATWFGAAADALRTLTVPQHSLRIEVVQGDVYEFLDRIDERPPAFPRSFDRVALSNVPDYAGGPITTFATVLPVVKEHASAFSTNSTILNTGAFEDAMKPLEDDKRPLESYLLTCVRPDRIGKPLRSSAAGTSMPVSRSLQRCSASSSPRAKRGSAKTGHGRGSQPTDCAISRLRHVPASSPSFMASSSRSDCLVSPEACRLPT